MPIHDWTRVTAGTWHAFHLSWIRNRSPQRRPAAVELLRPSRAIADPWGRMCSHSRPRNSLPTSNTRTVRAAAWPWRPPLPECDSSMRWRWTIRTNPRTLVIRHVSGDRIIALLELVSPGNKASRSALESFVDKAIEALHGVSPADRGPLPARPATRRASMVPLGRARPTSFALPPSEPLTLAAYSAGQPKRATSSRRRSANG